jgi:hypothetical protein
MFCISRKWRLPLSVYDAVEPATTDGRGDAIVGNRHANTII